MPAAIALSTPVGASAETIYAALTTSPGLASFWTSDCHVETVVGSVGRFGFPSGSNLEIKIDELDPERRVAWTLLNDLVRGPHWAGTSVSWDLSTLEDGAIEILFQQVNWPKEMPQTALARVTYIWAQVLRALKNYAETGTPQPLVAGVAR